MSKVATKISGIITLICSIFLLFVSFILVGSMLELSFVQELVNSVSFIGAIQMYFAMAFIEIPCYLINSLVASLDLETLGIVFVSLFAAYSVLLLFFGIKEISISHRDDVDFAHCKKTCGFIFFTKFMFFAYSAFVLAGMYLIDDIKLQMAFLELMFAFAFNTQNIVLIATIVIVVVSLALFLMPAINVGVVASKVKKDSMQNRMAGEAVQNNLDANAQNINPQGNGQFYQQNPQPTMQANMPPLPGFNSNVSTFQQPAQPAQNANPNPQPAPQQPNMAQPQTGVAQPQNPAQPGQPNAEGVVLDAKTQADLDRIERLKNMGAITEENYQAMKKKILEGK